MFRKEEPVKTVTSVKPHIVDLKRQVTLLGLAPTYLTKSGQQIFGPTYWETKEFKATYRDYSNSIYVHIESNAAYRKAKIALKDYHTRFVETSVVGVFLAVNEIVNIVLTSTSKVVEIEFHENFNGSYKLEVNDKDVDTSNWEPLYVVN